MPNIIQRDAAKLAGQPPKFRWMETCFALLYPFVLGLYAWRAAPAMRAFPLLVPAAVLSALLLADFISGFFHWLFDTWGTPESPLIGPLWIRTFREHHVDEKAITRHDFIETNGSNIFAGTVIGLPQLALDPSSSQTSAFFGSVLVFASIFVAMTSQIHKWAHMDRPPRVVGWLQRSRLLLSPEHHAAHHAPPFHRHYCITCGWLNGLLAQIRFFPVLERAITACTGAIPRQDDIGVLAAIASLQVADGDGDVVLPAARERVVDQDLT
jgi:ubiquitin-conjugating enzyme E2 variant